MQCENQMKRTSVAMGQAHPVWKEEVTFKSVQITSDLQVSTNTPLDFLTYCFIHHRLQPLPSGKIMPNSIQHSFLALPWFKACPQCLYMSDCTETSWIEHWGQALVVHEDCV